MARKHLDEETREVVTSARRQARRIGERLDEFARFTRVLRLETEEADLRALVQSVARAHGDEILVEGEARAYVDRGKMEEALDAVVGLLARHGRAGARIRLTLSGGSGEWSLAATGETVELDADAVERLFDPYVRTRPRDIGRGLAFARAVFQAHGGELRSRRRGRSLTLLGAAPFVPPGEGS